MQSAAKWCQEFQSPSSHILIATDSKSLCQALLGHNPSVDELKLQLDLCPGPITIQWIPGHAEIPGNDLADIGAKNAAQDRTTTPRGISFRGVLPSIKKTITDGIPSHARTAAVYSNLSASRERLITKRADQTMLARIRSGHSLLFRAYKHRISGSGDPRCKRCNTGAEDTVEHWLECPATLEERMRNFGYSRVELSDLTLWPRESVALARKTLFRGAGRG